jgi:hypothetical protein
LPLIFAFAAMQDWDGVFVFAYSHRRDEWDTGKITGFFDIDQHPTKMATLPAATALFLRGDLSSPKGVVEAHPSRDAMLESVRRFGPAIGAGVFGVPRDASLRMPVALALDRQSGTGSTSDQPPSEVATPSVDSPWRWNSVDDQGEVTVNTKRSKLLITARLGVSYDLGLVSVKPLANPQNWAVISLMAIDGADFAAPGRILITATGDARNTSMRWTSPDRSSVGAEWGRRPTLVDGIPAMVRFTVPPSRLRAWVLDERGRRRTTLAVSAAGTGAAITLSPERRTLWYEVEIGHGEKPSKKR